jgi:hypothetical protein
MIQKCWQTFVEYKEDKVMATRNVYLASLEADMWNLKVEADYKRTETICTKHQHFYTLIKDHEYGEFNKLLCYIGRAGFTAVCVGGGGN